MTKNREMALWKFLREHMWDVESCGMKYQASRFTQKTPWLDSVEDLVAWIVKFGMMMP